MDASPIWMSAQLTLTTLEGAFGLTRHSKQAKLGYAFTRRPSALILVLWATPAPVVAFPGTSHTSIRQTLPSAAAALLRISPSSAP